jgi:hypothetical protein
LNAMIDRLASFLDRMAASPFVDGHRDCALTVAGWVMTATPVPGDVGLIVVGEQQLAAIRLRALWAVKSSRGCVALAADRVVKSWRVPNG